MKILTEEQYEGFRKNLRFNDVIYIIEKLASDESKQKILTDEKYQDPQYKAMCVTNRDELYKFLEELNPENPKYYIERFERMEKKNADIGKCNCYFIDDKFINALGNGNKEKGEEMVNQLSCYKDTVYDILSLSEKELKLFGLCLNSYMEQNNTQEFCPLAYKILTNIRTYDNLIENINDGDWEKLDIKQLISILQYKNEGYCNLNTLEDLQNFENRKKSIIDGLSKSEKIEDIRASILLDIYDITESEAEKLIRKYESLEKIKNEDLKAYIKSLKIILEEKDKEILRQISEINVKVEHIDSISIERKLKSEFFQLYIDQGLFSIDEAVKTRRPKFDIYELPIDEAGNVKQFNMLLHSLHAYRDSDKIQGKEKYYDDWNMPVIATQQICTTYIGRDMLVTANCPCLFYGFNEVKSDSLMIAGPRDLSSGDNNAIIGSYCEKYLAPEEMLNSTQGHNEFCIRRVEDGKKRQPDYIVIFKEIDGKTPLLKNAQKAAKEFEKETKKKMPILIIDREKCLNTTIKQVESLMKQYDKISEPSEKEKLKTNIEQILSNIQKSIYHDQIEGRSELVADLSSCYDSWKKGDISTAMEIIQKRIRNIKQKETETKQEEQQSKVLTSNNHAKTGQLTQKQVSEQVFKQAYENTNGIDRNNVVNWINFFNRLEKVKSEHEKNSQKNIDKSSETKQKENEKSDRNLY